MKDNSLGVVYYGLLILLFSQFSKVKSIGLKASQCIKDEKGKNLRVKDIDTLNK